MSRIRSFRGLGRRPSLSPALVVAMLALFVSLGGSAYAALSLPRNSVGSAQLKAGAVTTAKLRGKAVTSGKVKDGSLLARDFKADQLPSGPQGLQGLKGDPGATGLAGETGPRGPSDAYFAETRGTSPIALPAGGGFVTVRSVSVPAGSFLLFAKLGLMNGGGGDGLALCMFPGELDEGSVVVPASGSFGSGSAEITLQHAATFASPATVSVECTATGAGSQVVTSFDKLTALEVDALH